MSNIFKNEDAPISEPCKDLLNFTKAAEALNVFIDQSDTPLCVSIQGHWGSGKSSLMRIMKSLFENGDYQHLYQTVEINTWEYYLSDDIEGGTQRAIASIICALENEKSLKSFRSSIRRKRSALQNFFAKGLGVVSAVNGGEGSSIAKLFGYDANTTKTLRCLFSDIVNRNTVPNQRYVFFIDDLDRIDPYAAISILDILKNVFGLNRCVFVIAVDFDVVVEGVRKKYGSNSIEGSAARDYFDKIFQLSYFMPLDSESLERFMRIGVEEASLLTATNDALVSKVVACCVAILDYNPRKTKIAVNNMRYRKAFDDLNRKCLSGGTQNMRAINAILASIEVIAPEIIKYLSRCPDFVHPNIKILKQLTKSSSTLQDDAEVMPWYSTFLNVLEKSEFESVSTRLVTALKFVDELLSNDSSVSFHDVLSLSSYAQQSIGEANIEEASFYENVETSYIYGKQLLEMATICPDDKVLHMGCQDGLITKEILLHTPASFVAGVEMQEALAEAAQKNMDASSVDSKCYEITYRQIEDMNEREEFDIVFSVTAAHWIKEPAYIQSFRALKPGGKLFFEQSGHGTYEEMRQVLMQSIADCIPRSEIYFSEEDPFYLPTVEELKSLLEDIGFVNVRVEESVDSGDAYEKLYDDYISTNALPYINQYTDDEKEQIKNTFLARCYAEKVPKTANLLWVFAEKRGR